MTGTMNIHGAGGQFEAHVARPDPSNAPCVVALHELFGVNDDMRKTCDELALQGFIAICPDLFLRQEPGVDLNSWSEAAWKKGLALYAAYDRNQGVLDIVDVVRAAKALEGASGKVGVMGFCLGGLMTFLTAARSRVHAAVAYHGGDTENYLDEANRITGPLLIHLADEDEFITREAQARIKSALAGNPHVNVYSYAGCKHAFARHNGTHHDAEAAATANRCTSQFLANELRGS